MANILRRICAVCPPFMPTERMFMYMDILDRRKGLFEITFCEGKCMIHAPAIIAEQYTSNLQAQTLI